jgi:hypothetical protein
MSSPHTKIGYIYLLHEREYVTTGQNIYKLDLIKSK